MMQQNRIQILSTRPIDQDQINASKELGIEIDCISFIETTAIENNELTKQIKAILASKATVVFTSMNAIDVVANHLAITKPDWNIYCMGVTSNQLIQQYFGAPAVVGTANNSEDLAKLIIAEKKSDHVVFFCGDQRRDELPNILKSNGVSVNEIAVYRTKEIEQQLDKVYDGILFFSPTAVISFFNSNSIPEKTIVFAIGKTTAATLASRTKNEMVIADFPGKQNLVKKMWDRFSGPIKN